MNEQCYEDHLPIFQGRVDLLPVLDIMEIIRAKHKHRPVYMYQLKWRLRYFPTCGDAPKLPSHNQQDSRVHRGGNKCTQGYCSCNSDPFSQQGLHTLPGDRFHCTGRKPEMCSSHHLFQNTEHQDSNGKTEKADWLNTSSTEPSGTARNPEPHMLRGKEEMSGGRRSVHCHADPLLCTFIHVTRFT